MRYFVLTLAVVLIIGASFKTTTNRPAVGVVNIGEIFDKYNKWRDIGKLLLDRHKIRLEEIESLAQEVEKLKEKLDKMSPETEEYKSTQALLIQNEALVTTKSEHYELDLARSEASQYDGVSLEIKEEIAALAKDLELTIVFQKTLETSEGFWESVVYSSKEIEITDRIIERLNKKYEKSK